MIGKSNVLRQDRQALRAIVVVEEDRPLVATKPATYVDVFGQRKWFPNPRFRLKNDNVTPTVGPRCAGRYAIIAKADGTPSSTAVARIMATRSDGRVRCESGAAR